MTSTCSCNYLLAILDDIFDITRLEVNNFHLNKEWFELKELILETMKIMAFQAQSKQITFITNISDQLPELIFSDQKRLKQILFNLLSNAVKFTFNGSINVVLEEY